MTDKEVYSMNKVLEEFYTIYSGDIQEVGDPTSGAKSSGIIKLQETDVSFGKVRFIDDVSLSNNSNSSQNGITKIKSSMLESLEL